MFGLIIGTGDVGIVMPGARCSSDLFPNRLPTQARPSVQEARRGYGPLSKLRHDLNHRRVIFAVGEELLELRGSCCQACR